METIIMDGLPPVSEDKQWTWRLAPQDQQESTEAKLADVHSHRTTAQGSQITNDSTQDGHRGKTSTLPRKENQGAAAQDFRPVGQVQWRRDHRQSITEEVRQDLRRSVMIWHKEDLTIHWLCMSPVHVQFPKMMVCMLQKINLDNVQVFYTHPEKGASWSWWYGSGIYNTMW